MTRHQFFIEQTKHFTADALCVPDMALALRNDCKEGAWYLGETSYGSRLQFIAVKFSRRLAGHNFGSVAAGTPLGQLWFVPIAGGIGSDEHGNEIRLPLNLVYYTVLKNSSSNKSGSLINFGQKATLVQSQGYDYREVIWTPVFRKKSATIDGEAVSYYVLDWLYQLPEQMDAATYKRVEQVVEVLRSPDELAKLFDPNLEATTRCVDGLTAPEMTALMENLKALPQGEMVF